MPVQRFKCCIKCEMRKAYCHEWCLDYNSAKLNLELQKAGEKKHPTVSSRREAMNVKKYGGGV